jgi:hypothetical protein
MFLQCRAGELPHRVIGAAARVLHSTRDVLDVVVNLLFIGRCRNSVRAYYVDQRLDALDKKSGLIFEVILHPCKTCFASLCAWGRLVYLKLGHALIPLVIQPVDPVTLPVIATVR